MSESTTPGGRTTKNVDLVLRISAEEFAAARKEGRKAKLPAFPRGVPKMTDSRMFRCDEADLQGVVARFREALTPRPVVFEHGFGPRGGLAAGKLLEPIVDSWGLSFEVALTPRATEEIEAGEWFNTSARFASYEDGDGYIRPLEIIHLALTNDPAIDGMPEPVLMCREGAAADPNPTPTDQAGEPMKPAERPGEESMEHPPVPAPTPAPTPAPAPAPAVVPPADVQIDQLVDRRVAEALSASEKKRKATDFVNAAILAGVIPEANRAAAEGLAVLDFDRFSALYAGAAPTVPVKPAVQLGTGSDLGTPGNAGTDAEVAKIAQFAAVRGLDLPTAWREMKAANLTRLEA